MSGNECKNDRENRFGKSIPRMGDYVMTLEGGVILFGHINSVEFRGPNRRVYVSSGGLLYGRTQEQVNVLVTSSFFERNRNKK